LNGASASLTAIVTAPIAPVTPLFAMPLIPAGVRRFGVCIRQLARVTTIAPVAVFLASDDGCMVSGATYDVTGGDSANYTAYRLPSNKSARTAARSTPPLTD
jgi:hypothetical protein